MGDRKVLNRKDAKAAKECGREVGFCVCVFTLRSHFAFEKE
jgi:hypothetical protein